MTTLSQALREAYASNPTHKVVLHTLELRHPGFAQPLRYVLDTQTLTAYLEATAPANPGQQVTFTPANFGIRLPEMTEERVSELEFWVDNIDITLLQQIEALAVQPYSLQVTYRPYLSTDLTGPQMDPPFHYTVISIDTDLTKLNLRAGFEDFASRPFPSEVYRPDVFPDLL